MLRKNFILILVLLGFGQPKLLADAIFCTQKVVLDNEGKLIPCYNPLRKSL